MTGAGEILECGHAPTPDASPGTGYAIAETGARMCYPCADTAQREELRTAARFGAYLSSDGRTVTSWSGGELATVTSLTDNGRQVWARARDVHGAEWVCQGAGRGMYLGMRRAAPPRVVWAVWDGGVNYSPGEIPTHLETFPSRTAARQALTDRARLGHWFPQSFDYADGRHVETLTPNADAGARMTVYLSDPRDTDGSPDFVYELTDRDTVQIVKV